MLGALTLNTSATGSSFLNNLAGEIQENINDAISDVAETLNIHDFYSAHILDYCEVTHCTVLTSGWRALIYLSAHRVSIRPLVSPTSLFTPRRT